MRIHQLFVTGFKRVAVSLTWAPAVVLFGPNDAGKSNILEAIAWANDVKGSRTDPLLEHDDLEFAVMAVIELDEIEDEESDDARLLAGLLQIRNVPPLFPYERQEAPRPDPDREQELWSYPAVLSQFPAALLEWDPADDEETKEARGFKVGCVGEIYSADDPVYTLGSLTRVRAALRERALALAESALDRSEEPIRQAFESLLDRCLNSRWLIHRTYEGIVWLPPLGAECTTGDYENATILSAAFDDTRIPVIHAFVEQLLGRKETAGAFLAIRTVHELKPWDAVVVAGSPERLEALTREVETFIRNESEWLLSESQSDPADAWLVRDEGGSTEISGRIREMCQRLSEHATAIAPPFVTRTYEIRVEPLEQVRWHSYDGRRIRLALAHREDDRTFDLSVVGSGLAIWAAFSVEEAMREVARELNDSLAALLRLQAESGQLVTGLDELGRPITSGSHDGRAPQREPDIGVRGRLYIFDEPERHLHPAAQAQAARWLTSRLDSKTFLVLATHSPAFLGLPTPEAEYALVTRGIDGTTRAESITSDVWGVLDARAAESGLGSRAHLVQLARAFLVVEGEHDKLVIDHFYGEDLARERVIILPIRGATKAKTLIEAELLAKLDVPLIILFDDVRARAVLADERPPGKDISVRALWEMLQSWPPQRRLPHVVEFTVPDIYCGVPDRCVANIVELHGGRFGGWPKLIQDFHRSESNIGFKPFFLRHSNLDGGTNTELLLREILEHCRLRPRKPLQAAMNEVIDRVRSA